MTENKTTSSETAELRRRAEEQALASAATEENLTPDEVRRVLHELRVHQIELEMQNEELRRTQTELEASQSRYFDLYDLAPVGYFTLGENGIVLETNICAASLFGATRSTLMGLPLSRFILPEDQDIFYTHRRRLFESGEPQAFELQMKKMDGTAFPAHLSATPAQEQGLPACRVIMYEITERKR